MAHFFVKLHIVCNIKQFFSRNHWKILHLADFFYTTSGCDGCDKYEVWVQPVTSWYGLVLPGTAKYKKSSLWQSEIMTISANPMDAPNLA